MDYFHRKNERETADFYVQLSSESHGDIKRRRGGMRLWTDGSLTQAPCWGGKRSTMQSERNSHWIRIITLRWQKLRWAQSQGWDELLKVNSEGRNGGGWSTQLFFVSILQPTVEHQSKSFAPTCSTRLTDDWVNENGKIINILYLLKLSFNDD